MKLQSKFITILLVCWVLVIAFTLFFTFQVIRSNYRTIERQSVETNLDRLQNAFVTFENSIDYLNADWAGWNDTYKFIDDLNDSYIESNLVAGTFADTKLDLIAYFDSNRKLKFSRFYNFKQQKFTELPRTLEPYIQPDSVFLQNLTEKSSHIGIVKLPEGYLIISTRPILRSTKTGPIKGTLLMGRFFENDEVALLAQKTDLQVSMLDLQTIREQPEFADVNESISKGHQQYIKPINRNLIYGYLVLKDVNGDPVFALRVESPRSIWLQGVKTSNFYLFCIMMAGILILGLLWMIIKKIIVDRLLRVSHEVVEIGDKSKFGSRVHVSGDDELTHLSTAVNTLLDVIEISHSGLEKRVRERTQELEKINADLRDEVFKREEAEKLIQVGEEQLDHMAHHDALTGLPNKVLFNEFLTRALLTAKRNNTQVAVLFLDLDRFKKINDALGHEAGDIFLKSLAAQFEQEVRGVDIVSRLGGDEFLFFATDFKNISEIEKIAQKILNIVALPQQIKGQAVQLSGSLGMAIFPTDGSNLEELVSNADVAMYKAKDSGKNQYHFFKEVLNIRAKEELKMEADLRNAIANKNFVLFYQPIFDLRQRRIAGAEALVRWQHEQFGLILPDKFISIAEKTNLIIALGEIILAQTLTMHEQWREKGLQPGFVTVNFSAIQFRDPLFLDKVCAILKQCNYSGEGLVAEMTESILMEAEAAAIAKLKALKALGVKVAIDDFGTGYSSLSYLQKFPLEYLKIDQAFVKNIPGDKDSCAITNAVIVLGHSLNLKTIAEGVETTDQMEYLAEHGCDFVQGYLISRPISKENMEELLLQNKKR